ncbi:MAG: peptidase family protein, partial [Enterovirga sp.]|nr:peptidase family protein [Enterovirga sp.]
PNEPAPASLGPRTSLEPATPSPPLGPAGARALQGIEVLPLREQFSRLEASMNRLGGSQIRYLGALAAGAQNGTALIRASLATLGLSVQPEPAADAKGRRPAGRVASLDAFQTRLAETEASLGQLERWRGLVELVPVRPPVDAETTPTSNFGTRKDPFTGAAATHAGIDFRGALGTPVKAAAAGRVVTADVSGGYGNLVEIEHGGGIVTRYAHLSGFSVAAGQSVAAGTVVGLLGSTGRSTGPHLHYETRINGSAVDPMRFLQAGAQIFDHPPPIAASLQADGEASFD